jgi:hypothetical protein
MVEVAEVAKKDFSQLKCRIIASWNSVQGGQIGEDTYELRKLMLMLCQGK